VTGGLARLWPPLTSAAPTGAGLSGRLTVLKDAVGQQVAYNGHPLYTLVDDRGCQVTGQGVQGFLVAPPASLRSPATRRQAQCRRPRPAAAMATDPGPLTSQIASSPAGVPGRGTASVRPT